MDFQIAEVLYWQAGSPCHGVSVTYVKYQGIKAEYLLYKIRPKPPISYRLLIHQTNSQSLLHVL